MKTATLSLLLVAASLTTTIAQDWKKIRPVSGFTSLQVSHGIDVYISQGNSEKLTIEAKGFDEDEVRAEVRNGVLRLYVDRESWGFNWGRNRYVKAYLTFKQLSEIKASGGSDLFSEGVLSFNSLNVNASGGSDLKLNLKADKLNLEVSGGSDAKLVGSVRQLSAESSGGSDLDARQLTAETCMINANGGSDAYVNASKEITMKASGGSDIYYSGSARVISKNESGGSDITRRN